MALMAERAPDSYPIVNVQPERVLNPEEMGSKGKFWYRHPGDDESRWLFKYPRQGTGEHWAEKIAEQVASVLWIAHARVELGQFGDQRGSVTESFSRGGRALYHGNQLLERVVRGYDPKKKFHQSDHTIVNIWRAIDGVFPDRKSVILAKRRLAQYMVLDALIGNTDRHHENWGILRRRVGGGWKGFIAPSFDHASSLGRELPDARRNRRLEEDRVGDYAERGRGAVYWSGDEPHGPSPLALVRQSIRHYLELFRPALAKLENVDRTFLSDLVNRIPACWMTSLARMFAIALINHNLERLRELVR